MKNMKFNVNDVVIIKPNHNNQFFFNLDTKKYSIGLITHVVKLFGEHKIKIYRCRVAEGYLRYDFLGNELINLGPL